MYFYLYRHNKQLKQHQNILKSPEIFYFRFYYKDSYIANVRTEIEKCRSLIEQYYQHNPNTFFTMLFA